VASVHIIWNPIAGGGTAKAVFERVSSRLYEHRIDYTAAMSERPMHAMELAKEAVAAGHGKVLVLGGDGTVREVACGMVGSDIPLAIIPCGTGNDLARALHIPREANAALDLALSGEVRSMDAALANDELYFNVAGFGFDVDVLDETERFKTRCKNGSMAYLLGLLSCLAHLNNRKTHVTWTDEADETHEADYRALVVAACNGTHFGGGMNVAPKADPFDGLLDICVLHDITIAAVVKVLPKFLKGGHLDPKYKKYVTYFRAKTLTAVCEPVSRIEVDGEVMPSTPVTFTVKPKSLLMIAK